MFQLRNSGRGLPVHEERVPRPVRPHLWRVWRRQDGGIQEDPPVHRRQQHALEGGGPREGQAATVQPHPGSQ